MTSWGRFESKVLVKPNKKINRCFNCRKKVGLLGFDCSHCDKYYCSSHRIPENHVIFGITSPENYALFVITPSSVPARTRNYLSAATRRHPASWPRHAPAPHANPHWNPRGYPHGNPHEDPHGNPHGDPHGDPRGSARFLWGSAGDPYSFVCFGRRFNGDPCETNFSFYNIK